MDSRSVAIAPLSSVGADGLLDHPASPAQTPAPRCGGRIAWSAFTITDLRVHHRDPGVHHERSGCSRCTDPGVHDRPIRAFTFGRHAHYQYATSESIIGYLATIQPPKDLTSALSWHIRWMVDPLPWSARWGTSAIVERLLTCGSRWEELDPKRIGQVRWSLVKAREYELRSIFRHLKRPEVCAPETLQELVRTPKMQEKLIAYGIIKKPLTERERRREEVARHQYEVARLSHRYDRRALYDQVWSQPVQEVAKACRKLQIPVPPRGYWARVKNGQKIKKPPLPEVR
jgi:hypothetical protein